MDTYWVPQPEWVWLPAHLERKGEPDSSFISKEPAGIKIVMKTAQVAGLEKVQGEQLSGVDDICSLSIVNEASMLHTVRSRYAKQQIYTLVSKILIAMNPFHMLPIYSKEQMDLYANAADGDTRLQPHVYGIGQDAMRGVRRGERDQTVLISGESGAGKTETAKLILSYVAEQVRGKHGGIEEKLLRTNPILEAFGNAMTVRNNNSSRFGKWLDMHFNDSVKMHCCSLTSYLLEVTRVCYQAEKERGYHIFFSLLRARSSPKLDLNTLNLDDAKTYRYLRGGQLVAPNVDDNKNMEDVKDAFRHLQFGEELSKEIFRILGGILVLGNVEFKEDNEEAQIVNQPVAKHAAELFKLPVDKVSECLVTKRMMVGREAMVKPVRADVAGQIRDSISRLVYGRLFLYLIDRMNAGLQLEDAAATSTPRLLGVLDIAGFESFEKNSLEQLLINLSNEHLQQQFNHVVFKSELDDYKKEGINLANGINFTDNSDVLELLDSRGSVLDLLDEAVSLPKCNDMQYVQNVFKAHEKHSRMVKPKFAGKALFGIKHFAGEVMYIADGFLEKNADRPPDDLPDLLKNSEIGILKDIGVALAEQAVPAGSGKAKKGKTASSGFRTSLRALMTKINAADPHYVRCIKPNAEKVPNKCVSTMIYQQLLFSGVFDAISIRRQGFSSRMPFKEFINRYMCCVTKEVRRTLNPAAPDFDTKKKDAQTMLTQMKMPAEVYCVGSTKVLLKQVAHSTLETKRECALVGPVVLIQSCWRRYKAKKSTAEARQIQKSLKNWLKDASVFDDAAKTNALKNKKRLTVALASNNAFKKLGSRENVDKAIAYAQPLLERADKIGFRNQITLEVQKTLTRMKMEVDCMNELSSLTSSIDPVSMDRCVIRARELGMPEDSVLMEVKSRSQKLHQQVPLINAMKVVTSSAGQPDARQLMDIIERMNQAGLKDNPSGWLADLGGAELAKQLVKMYEAIPEVKSGEPLPAQTGPRKTITGMGVESQARIKHGLAEAVKSCDAEALETLLKEAVQCGLPLTDQEDAKQRYAELHMEEFLKEAVKEARAQAESSHPPKAVFKKLHNLANQIRKIQGTDVDLYREAAQAAQKATRHTIKPDSESFGRDIAESIFGDLSSFRGLKPSTLANRETSLKYQTDVIDEALTVVPDNLEAKAVQCFRNIMIGMYDKPTSDLEVMSARQAVMELACSVPELRNEIYVQAMKQVQDNPSERSVLMGWQLLRFLCQASPPRPDLVEFVEAFASRAINSSLTGVPDERFLRAAAIPEEEWSAYTVDVSQEAKDCLAALARPRSWILASSPNSSAVALQAKSYSSAAGPPGQALEMDTNPRQQQLQTLSRGPDATRNANCADRCTNCVAM